MIYMFVYEEMRAEKFFFKCNQFCLAKKDYLIPDYLNKDCFTTKVFNVKLFILVLLASPESLLETHIFALHIRPRELKSVLSQAHRVTFMNMKNSQIQ